jgi:hypothetical protein
MTIAYPLMQRDTQRFDEKGFYDLSLLGPRPLDVVKVHTYLEQATYNTLMAYACKVTHLILPNFMGIWVILLGD